MENMMRKVMAGVLAGAVSLTGCAADVGPSSEGASAEGGKEDRWNAANDPANFRGRLNYNFAALPTSGHAERTAWPSTYWPTSQDSINARWNTRGEGRDRFSPAEKYDLAFNGWQPSAQFDSLRPWSSYGEWDRGYYEQLGPLARHVSTNMGNAAGRDGRDNDGDGEIDEADERPEGWWGLCHAWVPAAMRELQPGSTPVVVNGVTFYAGDLEALVIAAYNRAGAAMIGDRCNDGGSGAGSSPVERDEHGRATDPACRDTNAGSFHVIMANYLGILHEPIAEDRTFDYEVWNQPVVSFEVTSSNEVTAAQANELLSRTGTAYELNRDARKLMHIRATATYITESHADRTPADPEQYKRTDAYEYILELDGRGNIIGGEWISRNHPDFLWNPVRLTRSSTPYLDLDRVRQLIEQSRAGGGGGAGGAVKSFEGLGGIDIPDNDSSGITSAATVGESITIASLQLELNVTHTYTGDLRIVLSHGGTERVVWDNEGGSADNIVRTIPVTGFEGQDAQGDWTLRIVDNAGQDVGVLVGWKLLVAAR